MILAGLLCLIVDNNDLDWIVRVGDIRPIDVRVAEIVVLVDDYRAGYCRIGLVRFKQSNGGLSRLVLAPDISCVYVPIPKEAVLPDRSGSVATGIQLG